MPNTTPRYAWPWPLGTDRVMDGDNAMGSLANAIETTVVHFGQGLIDELDLLGTAIGTADTNLGQTKNWTIGAGRAIRIDWTGVYYSAGDAHTVAIALARTGAKQAKSQTFKCIAANDLYLVGGTFWDLAPPAGTQSWQLLGARTGGTASHSFDVGNYRCTMSVTDVGAWPT